MKNIFPEFGFGAWQIGGKYETEGSLSGWNVGSEQYTLGLVEKALECGVRFFDTAQAYGSEKNEQLIGRALRNKKREQAIICTKISIGDDIKRSDYGSYLRKSINISLSNLGTDYIDILLLHNPSIKHINEHLSSELSSLKSTGVIRDYGLSAKFLVDLIRASEISFGNYCEWNYSLLERRIEPVLLEFFNNKAHKFIARSPLFRGIITDSFLQNGPDLVFDDVRSCFSGDCLSWVVHTSPLKIREYSNVFNLTASEFALAYLYSNENVIYIIPGIGKLMHLEVIKKIKGMSIKQLNSIKKLDLDIARNYSFN